MLMSWTTQAVATMAPFARRTNKMLKYLIFVYLLMQVNTSPGNVTNREANDDMELLMVYFVNRHGERAPDDVELSLSDQQEELKSLTHVEGPEGLTNVGKRRAYQIGKFIRQRYGSEGSKILSKVYLKDEILVRSTDKDRTKMTALVAMSAAYPPEPVQQWDESLGKIWQPVPYYSVPLNEDYLRYFSNCDRFVELMRNAKDESIRQEFAPYLDVMQLLSRRTGQNFVENPLLLQALFDLFRSSLALGLNIPEWAKPFLESLSEGARLAYKLYFRNNEMKKIAGGVLLNKFTEQALIAASGKEIKPRLHVFSSHDFNLGAFMEVSRVRSNHGIPEYGAAFALELYRSKVTGELSVLPMYLPQAGDSTPQVLQINGCDTNPCGLTKFMELTKDFLLPEQEYYRICNIKTEL
ncbi:prostatic acid phosphatase-like [Bombyx mandarina]|uniref:acid phosphatase n=1 Tax=Bombyx mandarina TaxID=7092 RepID=A0A6J2JAD7_BOMMA|nr:prostatic acid phosphatase-like [Bombyx mandarina]